MRFTLAALLALALAAAVPAQKTFAIHHFGQGFTSWNSVLRGNGFTAETRSSDPFPMSWRKHDRAVFYFIRVDKNAPPMFFGCNVWLAAYETHSERAIEYPYPKNGASAEVLSISYNYGTGKTYRSAWARVTFPKLR